MSGAPVFRISDPNGPCKYLKVARGLGGEALREEIVGTEWLSLHGVRVPNFDKKFHAPDLTAVLMTAVPGKHLVAYESADFVEMVRSMARGLARLHAIPSTDCPFDERSRARLHRAKQAIDRNLIDPGQFDARNAGLTPSMLYERLVAVIPACDDVVVVHGDATISNMLIDAGGELGFIDCGHAGRSDRYLDLALVEAELRTEFGSDAAECLIDSYGVSEWDDRKADFFRDLYELF
jgi:aminoglycoside 3'-phosphotransferase-1